VAGEESATFAPQPTQTAKLSPWISSLNSFCACHPLKRVFLRIVCRMDLQGVDFIRNRAFQFFFFARMRFLTAGRCSGAMSAMFQPCVQSATNIRYPYGARTSNQKKKIRCTFARGFRFHEIGVLFFFALVTLLLFVLTHLLRLATDCPVVFQCSVGFNHNQLCKKKKKKTEARERMLLFRPDPEVCGKFARICDNKVVRMQVNDANIVDQPV
jgi:hypothetical protein